MAHAYLSARIFSKSFGGKIEKFSAEVVYRNHFLRKMAHAYLSARIFLSLLAGKLKNFQQRLLTEIIF